MSNYLIKYSRKESVKYISHLDFVRFIQRVVRRSGLSMKYSEGFNPHPQMAVALPLSVGVTADAELMRLGLVDDYSEEYVKDTLNKALGAGFEIIDVKNYGDKKIDFSYIKKAWYICYCEVKKEEDINIDEFMKNESILVMKKTKSGIHEADIKEHIHNIEYVGRNDDVITLKMCLDAGNLYNLKPDTVIDAIIKYCNVDIDFYKVHRISIL